MIITESCFNLQSTDPMVRSLLVKRRHIWYLHSLFELSFKIKTKPNSNLFLSHQLQLVAYMIIGCNYYE